MRPSIEHEKSTRSSGEKARPVTQPLCSCSVRTCSPVSESQVLIVVSCEPVKISRRAGLYATHRIGASWAGVSFGPEIVRRISMAMVVFLAFGGSLD